VFGVAAADIDGAGHTGEIHRSGTDHYCDGFRCMADREPEEHCLRASEQ
jgi:hypothetical protein